LLSQYRRRRRARILNKKVELDVEDDAHAWTLETQPIEIDDGAFVSGEETNKLYSCSKSPPKPSKNRKVNSYL
jgi:hypothetical protein